MKKKKFSRYLPKELKKVEDAWSGEEEISQFLKEYLTQAFPRLTHIKTKWVKTKWKKNDKQKEVDAIALHREKNWKVGEERLALLEYKWKDKSDPVVQVTNYFGYVENNQNVLRKLEDEYNEYLEKNEGKGIKWVFKNQGEKDAFLEKRILIAVAIPGKFNDEIIRRANKKHDETILVEIRKYENDETKTEIILLSLIQKEKSEEYQRLLGINSDHVVIQRKLNRKGGANEGEMEPTSNEWVIIKISEINKEVQLFDNSIEGKETQRNKYFGYKKKGRKLFCTYHKQKEKGFTVYLRKNKATARFDEKNISGDSGVRQFEQQIIIKDERIYQRFSEKLESYLKEVIKTLGT